MKQTRYLVKLRSIFRPREHLAFVRALLWKIAAKGGVQAKPSVFFLPLPLGEGRGEGAQLEGAQLESAQTKHDTHPSSTYSINTNRRPFVFSHLS